MTEGIKISQETAENELLKFAKVQDIDLNDETNKTHKERLIRAILDDLLYFEENEDGELLAVQKTKNGTVIKYGSVTPDASREMQKHDNSSDGLLAFIGQITKLGPDALGLLKNRDMKIMNAVAVFLAV